MPYAMIESFHPFLDTHYDTAMAISAGINLRPSPSFVIKLQGSWAKFLDDDTDGGLAGEHARTFTSQVAWMF